MWGAWQIPPTPDQKKKWESIPDGIFWLKMSILIGLALIILVSFIVLINN